MEYLETGSYVLHLHKLLCRVQWPELPLNQLETDLSVFLQVADSDLLSRFQAAVLKPTFMKFKGLVRLVNKCAATTQVTPDALPVIREINAALIDLLRWETGRKAPEHTIEMARARYPKDANIEKFLRGSRSVLKIVVFGNRMDTEKLTSEIQAELRSLNIAEINVELCDTQEGPGVNMARFRKIGSVYVTLTKSVDQVYEGQLANYTENCRLLEELVTQQEEIVAKINAGSRIPSPDLQSPTGESDVAEPPSKRAKMAD